MTSCSQSAQANLSRLTIYSSSSAQAIRLFFSPLPPTSILSISRLSARAFQTPRKPWEATDINASACTGNGGLGKTTALQFIAEELPEQSAMVVYDCYGAGSYLDASKSRHRQRDAFVQLANEVAERLKLPTYLVPRNHTDFPRALRRRIDEAAKLLSSLNDKALLVVTADAIDNASTAARSKHPPEPSFFARFDVT